MYFFKVRDMLIDDAVGFCYKGVVDTIVLSQGVLLNLFSFIFYQQFLQVNRPYAFSFYITFYSNCPY
jgi:hypothetical protein